MSHQFEGLESCYSKCLIHREDHRYRMSIEEDKKLLQYHFHALIQIYEQKSHRVEKPGFDDVRNLSHKEDDRDQRLLLTVDLTVRLLLQRFQSSGYMFHQIVIPGSGGYDGQQHRADHQVKTSSHMDN